MSQKPAKSGAETWLLRRAFRHVVKLITARLAPSPPPVGSGRKGKGGNAGGWHPYVRKVPRKPGIVALHHEQRQPERAAVLKDGLRRAGRDAALAAHSTKAPAPRTAPRADPPRPRPQP